MKRIKMMLLSFALLAVIGGALAFKAKFGLLELCYTVTTGPVPAPSCALINNVKEDPLGITVYTTAPVFFQDRLQCTKNALGGALTCTTTATISTN